MKKISLFFALLLFIGTAFSFENVKNVVVISVGANLNEGENIWLADSVKDKFESNLQTYTNYTFISSNDVRIRELQKNMNQ